MELPFAKFQVQYTNMQSGAINENPLYAKVKTNGQEKAICP